MSARKAFTLKSNRLKALRIFRKFFPEYSQDPTIGVKLYVGATSPKQREIALMLLNGDQTPVAKAFRSEGLSQIQVQTLIAREKFNNRLFSFEPMKERTIREQV